MDDASRLLSNFYDEHKRYPDIEEFKIENLESVFERYIKNRPVVEGRSVGAEFYFFDLYNGEMLHYNPISNNESVLYSVGPDGKDDCGMKYDPETRTGDITLHLKDGRVMHGQLHLKDGKTIEP